MVNNLVSMGAHTDIISVIGDCESSEEVMSIGSNQSRHKVSRYRES